MFKVELQSKIENSPIHTQVVSADTLHEAELLALSLLSRCMPDKKIMIVHVGNLIYNIYEINEPIGKVRIKTM